MFRYVWHQRILEVLACLRAEFLSECQAYFGGGTLVALSYQEHRQSKDIDFLCPFGPGYSRLRTAVFDQGYEALFANQAGVSLPREIRADQYGIRFPIQVQDALIKFEVVAEGRIPLEQPEHPSWAPVACLGLIDVVAEKLLANSDRWADSSTASRDLIDLGIIRSEVSFPEVAIAKAEAAYPVVAPLKKALHQFLENQTYQERCFELLQVRDRDRILSGLTLLTTDFPNHD